LSAGHIDWHEWDGTDVKVSVILDDASRMVLTGGEFTEINTENSKLIIDQLVDKFWWLCPMRELMLDHESEFGAHKIHDEYVKHRSAFTSFDEFITLYNDRPHGNMNKHPELLQPKAAILLWPLNTNWSRL
jgi:hypothetical protein